MRWLSMPTHGWAVAVGFYAADRASGVVCLFDATLSYEMSFGEITICRQDG
jgi:hypothetical protein